MHKFKDISEFCHSCWQKKHRFFTPTVFLQINLNILQKTFWNVCHKPHWAWDGEVKITTKKPTSLWLSYDELAWSVESISWPPRSSISPKNLQPSQFYHIVTSHSIMWYYPVDSSPQTGTTIARVFLLFCIHSQTNFHKRLTRQKI